MDCKELEELKPAHGDERKSKRNTSQTKLANQSEASNGGQNPSLSSVKNGNQTSDILYSSVVRKPMQCNSMEFINSSRTIKSQDVNNGQGVIIGSNTARNDSLKSACRRSQLFVSRVSPDKSCEDVLAYLSGKGIEDRECFDLPSRFKTYKSFKVSVPENLESVVLEPEFWPAGLLVRPFIQSRRMPRDRKKPFLGRAGPKTYRT